MGQRFMVDAAIFQRLVDREVDGRIFSQYEFAVPLSDRLTDEAWREILEVGETPGLEDWKRSYILD